MNKTTASPKNKAVTLKKKGSSKVDPLAMLPGKKRVYGSILSFISPADYKAALILHAAHERMRLSAVGVEAVKEYIRNHDLRVPEDDEIDQLLQAYGAKGSDAIT